MTKCKPDVFVVYKGFPTRWNEVDWLSIKFSTETFVDFTNFSAKFAIGGYVFEHNNLYEDWVINLTDEQTATLPLGPNTASLIVYDTEGLGKPFTTSIPVLVKNWVDGDVTVDTYKATIKATLDGRNEFIVKVETAKISVELIEEMISAHNESSSAHPYIQGLIDDEKQARINVDNQLSDRIDAISGDLSNYRTAAQQDVIDNNLQTQITANTNKFANYRTRADQDVIDNAQDIAIAGKQAQLTQAQLNAVNSGITSAKVTSYDNHISNNNIHVTTQDKTNWNNKQNALNQAQMNAVNSGITSSKVSTYDNHIADTTIHVTAQDKTNWNGKQDALSQTQMAAVNSGATTTNIGQITTNKNAIGTLSNLTTTNRTDLVSAVNEVNGIAEMALQPADIVNSVESTATDKALSANMGKELQDQVDNLKARGRFLALWNCATGLAESNPPTGTYTYQSGDYFIVGNVAQAGGTNYKPDGATYTTGVASTVVETQPVDTDDVYYYDGHVWRLQVNTQKTISFDNIAGSPYDNSNLASALGDKQNALTQGDGISIDSSTDTISNSGVRSISTGVTNGTISVNTNGTSAEVAVAGLGSAAYTNSTDYATSTQGGKADTALQPNDNITELNNNAGYITSAALSGYEQTTNKVTSLSSSSTDTEYPSAKCVYDIIGDVESLLYNINSGS